MRQAFVLGVIAALSILVTFVNQWFIIVTIGPGLSTDALYAGLAIPQLVLAMVSGSLMHVLVPLLSGNDPTEARADAWTLMAFIGILFGAVTLVLVVFAPLWAPLLFPGFRTDGAALLVQLTRIQAVGMLFAGLSGVLWAFNHSQKRFIWADGSQFVATVLALGLLVWLLPRIGIVAAAWTYVGRAVLQFAFLLPGLGWPSRAARARATVREAWKRLQPLLVGTAYYKTDPVLDRVLASMSPAGELSLLYLGQQMFGAATKIVNNALAAPLVPLLSTEAKNRNWGAFRVLYRQRLAWIGALTGGGYVAFVFIGREVLSLVIGHGGVTAQNVDFLWKVMVALVGVFVAGALGQVTSVAFYSEGDTRTPTRLGIVTYTVYVPLKIIAYLRFGVIALAIATSAFVIVNTALQYILMERNLRRRIPLVDEPA